MKKSYGGGGGGSGTSGAIFQGLIFGENFLGMHFSGHP